MVYVVENNLYGVANCQRDYMKVACRRPGGPYGFPGVTVDGNDVSRCAKPPAKRWIARAAAEARPSSTADLAALGPLHRGRGDLSRPRGTSGLARTGPADHHRGPAALRGVGHPGRLDQIQADADAEMREALEFGKASPFPDVEELYAASTPTEEGGRNVGTITMNYGEAVADALNSRCAVIPMSTSTARTWASSAVASA